MTGDISSLLGTQIWIRIHGRMTRSGDFSPKMLHILATFLPIFKSFGLFFAKLLKYGLTYSFVIILILAFFGTFGYFWWHYLVTLIHGVSWTWATNPLRLAKGFLIEPLDVAVAVHTWSFLLLSTAPHCKSLLFFWPRAHFLGSNLDKYSFRLDQSLSRPVFTEITDGSAKITRLMESLFEVASNIHWDKGKSLWDVELSRYTRYE